MKTETIDNLFLELSQVTTAKTARELELEKKIRDIYPAQVLNEIEGYHIERLAICLQQTKRFMERAGLNSQLLYVYVHLSDLISELEETVKVNAVELRDQYEERRRTAL